MQEITIMEQVEGICEIGKLVSEGSCHKAWYKKEKGYKQLSELSKDEILTLFWRAGFKSCLEDGSLVINNCTKVCYHHYCMYLTCFDKKQNNCNNLFDIHAKSRKRKQRRGTHLVSLQIAKQLEGKFGLIPGEKLCRECWMYTKNILDDHNSPSEDAGMQELSLSKDARESLESSSAENYSTLLDDSLAACKVSPFKSTGKSKCQKLFHASQKTEKVTKTLEKAFSTKGVDIAICCTPSTTRSTDEKNFDQLMFELKTKFQQTTSLSEFILFE